MTLILRLMLQQRETERKKNVSLATSNIVHERMIISMTKQMLLNSNGRCG